MDLSRLVGMVAIAIGLILGNGRAEAGITGLYNTGVGETGNPLANGTLDTHYQYSYYQAFGAGQTPIVPTNTSTYAVNPNPAAFPIGPWVANDAKSSWISADSSIHNGTSDPNGYYVYKTTFSVTDSPAGLSLTGQYSADDQVAYLLNPTGPVNPSTLNFTPDQGYGSLHPLNITSGFQTGTNNLYFIVANTHSGPEGLRVEFNAVPEPSSIAMVGLGLLGVVGHLRARRSRHRAKLLG